MSLTARDMLKLGQVYLDGGEWGGDTIMSRTWAQAAVRPLIEVPPPGAASFVRSSAYGFQWWYDVHEWEDGALVFHSAVGNGGQRIIIIPELDMVVAVFAGFYEEPSNGRTPEALVRTYVLPAVRGASQGNQ